MKSYFGFAKVRILPPKRLYHPVLPYKSQGKLTFPLCGVCADERNHTYCEHSSKERQLTGTWTTIEINKAVEMGYKIKEVYEVWHFQERTKGIFKDYVAEFLKIKQESSDYPDWVTTEEDKLKYIGDYKTNMGIDLDPSKIEKNEGLRFIAKLLLNSLWGKFGQRNNMNKTVYFTDTSKDLESWHKFWSNNQINHENVHIDGITKHMLEVTYAHKKDSMNDDFNTNIYLASWTTSSARLRLYDALEKLDQQVLYFDTDSIIYIERKGCPKIQLGDNLGDWTSELNDGEYIEDFVGLGPKNYGYQTNNGKQIVKVKGINLHFMNRQLVNFTSMKHMSITKNKSEPIKVDAQRFDRDSLGNIKTTKMKKDYQFGYDKRFILDNGDTLPFGSTKV
jgi:hypothetical protein